MLLSRYPGGTAGESPVFSPPHKKAFLFPSSNPFHLPHRGRTSGKFKQGMQIEGCVQEDRNRLYKMAARVIAWKEINSNLSTESKAASVYICPFA